jgi:hypothetical protein
MTTGDETIDEGGEAPCFAHLLDQPPVIDDVLPAGLVCDLGEAVAAATARSHVYIAAITASDDERHVVFDDAVLPPLPVGPAPSVG